MNPEEPIYNTCNECGQSFDSAFQLIDHLLEDDEDFDPALLLPNGFRLMIGSLLRFFYENSDKPEQIRTISQSTYVTLFASENGYDPIEELVEDMIVRSALHDFDSSLKKLLEEEKPNDNEDGA